MRPVTEDAGTTALPTRTDAKANPAYSTATFNNGSEFRIRGKKADFTG